MSEYEFGFLLGILTGVIFSFILLYLYIRNLIKKVVSEIDLHIDQVKDKLIPVFIEKVDGQLYCYNEKDKQFICQGADILEIKAAFEKRFPDKTAYLASGEAELVKELQKQLQEINEVSPSK